MVLPANLPAWRSSRWRLFENSKEIPRRPDGRGGGDVQAGQTARCPARAGVAGRKKKVFPRCECSPTSPPEQIHHRACVSELQLAEAAAIAVRLAEKPFVGFLCACSQTCKAQDGGIQAAANWKNVQRPPAWL